MTLSNKSRIAIDAMLDVAVHGALAPVALAAISARQNVSLSYLEQLFRCLRRHGFVKSLRGPGGGFQLSKRASAISIADIVTAVAQEPIGGRAPKGRRRDPRADELWRRLDRHLLDYLRTVTLAAVMQESGPGQRLATPPRRAAAAAPERCAAQHAAA